MDRVARRDPLARAPGALKGDTYEIVNIFVAVEGGTLGPFGEKKQIFEKKSHNAEKLKRGTLWGFSTSILSQNIKKLKWGKIFIFGKNISQCRKNWKGGPFGIFQHPFWRKTARKMKGGPFGEKIFPKVSQCRKKIKRGDPLVSPGMVCYAEKQEKPFWFSSLGQMVQFGAIIFCRTFTNDFGQFVWVEKKSL